MTTLSQTGGIWPSPQQLLILKASLWQGDAAIQAWKLWVDKIDINADFDYETFRLLPMLYHNMHQHGMSGHVMNRLKGLYRKSWFEQKMLVHKALPYLQALQQEGMDFLLLKGLPLGIQYYKNIALRPMSDIDILIHHSQAQKGIDFFESRSWDRHLNTWNEDIHYRHSMPFYKDKLEIDLHWYGLVDNCDENINRIWWANSIPISVLDLEVKTLSPTDMLFHSIIHGMRWNKEPAIRWIADAYKIIEAEPDAINWDLFVKKAKKLAFTQRLALGLTFLINEMKLDIPESVIAQLQSSKPTLIEWLESSYVLKAQDNIYRHPMGKLWAILIDYQSVGPRRHIIPHVFGLSHYLRNRLRAKGRLVILQETVAGIIRRIREYFDKV
ncbi:MAG: hypothetical protein ACI9QD_000730 [Thermoproteota archaeon]|jgi:hypothetical protein